MTELARIRNTIYSNPSGIMSNCMTFNIQDRMPSNTRMYFYKFSYYDLVEISYDDDVICVFDFQHTIESSLDYIRENLEFLAGYFKSAGLHGKRFIFNTSLKMPVSYNDFIVMDKIERIDMGNQSVFILDKKNGYITDRAAVNIFSAHEYTKDIDKLILSMYNRLIGIKKPEVRSTDSGVITFSIAGFLDGIKLEGVLKQIDTVEPSNKFKVSIGTVNIDSSYVISIFDKLKTGKFKKILNKVDKIIDADAIDDGGNLSFLEKAVKSGNTVFLRDIIDVGLDKFSKSVKNPHKAIPVHLDCEWQTIKSMYIFDGVAFISPTTMMPMSYFRELLSSDNIEYVMS
jgi:hypothetical protein